MRNRNEGLYVIHQHDEVVMRKRNKIHNYLMGLECIPENSPLLSVAELSAIVNDEDSKAKELIELLSTFTSLRNAPCYKINYDIPVLRDEIKSLNEYLAKGEPLVKEFNEARYPYDYEKYFKYLDSESRKRYIDVERKIEKQVRDLIFHLTDIRENMGRVIRDIELIHSMRLENIIPTFITPRAV